MKRVIPDFLIEQLYLDELDPRLKERLMRQPGVAGRVERLRASNTEILSAYPPAVMGPLIEARLRTESQGGLEGSEVIAGDLTGAGFDGGKSLHAAASGGIGRRPVASLRGRMLTVIKWRGFYPALAAAAILALAVGVLPLAIRGGVGPSSETGFQIKGVGPVLHVYRETPGGAELLANGALVGAHDLLQLSYLAAGARYGMIFSVDGSGTVTLHYPQSGPDAAALESGGEVALPYSYELDNAPSFERFYFVTAGKQFPLAEILDIARKAVRKGSPPTIAFPPGFQATVFTLNKEAKR